MRILGLKCSLGPGGRPRKYIRRHIFDHKLNASSKKLFPNVKRETSSLIIFSSARRVISRVTGRLRENKKFPKLKIQLFP